MDIRAKRMSVNKPPEIPTKGNIDGGFILAELERISIAIVLKGVLPEYKSFYGAASNITDRLMRDIFASNDHLREESKRLLLVKKALVENRVQFLTE